MANLGEKLTAEHRAEIRREGTGALSAANGDAALALGLLSREVARLSRGLEFYRRARAVDGGDGRPFDAMGMGWAQENIARWEGDEGTDMGPRCEVCGVTRGKVRGYHHEPGCPRALVPVDR